MKKLSISDLQPELSFTFGDQDPFYYTVSSVHSEPSCAKVCNSEILVPPHVICFSKLKKFDHLLSTQVDISFDLLEIVDFYSYPFSTCPTSPDIKGTN